MNRLHPRVQLVWMLRSAIGATVVGVAAFFLNRATLELPVFVPVGLFAVLLVVGIGFAALRYRLWGYEVRGDSLYLERGVLTRVRTVVPFVRIQHVDSARGPVERVLGLASTVVYTAGSRGADVRVPGLTADGSDELQDRLKGLAIRAEGDDAV
ncbi:PH domain-containing protein [Halogranum rubrum]|nr:PH domain-containing protein [Halogranum rubrum]